MVNNSDYDRLRFRVWGMFMVKFRVKLKIMVRVRLRLRVWCSFMVKFQIRLRITARFTLRIKMWIRVRQC